MTLSPWNFSFPFDVSEFCEVARHILCGHDVAVVYQTCTLWRTSFTGLLFSVFNCYKTGLCTGLSRCKEHSRVPKHEWCRFTCASAAGMGHYHCLRYLHQNGCPWDKWTPVLAAKIGHLDCLTYAIENWCPHDTEYLYDAAVENGQTACMRYLISRGIVNKRRPGPKWSEYNPAEVLY